MLSGSPSTFPYHGVPPETSFTCAFEQVAHPVIGRFAPDWVLVSCGFDAHRADPLGELALSTGNFRCSLDW